MPLKAKKKLREVPQRRKHARYAPEPGTYAQIDLDAKSPAFRPDHMGLVVEESYTGCGLVVVDMPKLKVGTKFKIQVGSLTALKAEVKWRKDLDAQVSRIGVYYLI